MHKTGLIAKISIKICFADIYLEIFPADFLVFRVFWGISRDFAEIPEFRGSATARNIRSPDYRMRHIHYYFKSKMLISPKMFN